MPKSVHQKLSNLVDRLAAPPLVSLQFNMYQGVAGKPLRENLRLFLNLLIDRKPELLFLGEAAGVHGARWTGVPFTDSLTLRFPPLVGTMNPFSGSYHIPSNYEYEQSSCPFWRVLQIHGRIELLWNACPFVPHEPGSPIEMRDTLQGDMSPYDSLTEELISLFPTVKHVIGVGVEATAAAKRVLKGMGSDLLLHEVQHPSRQANVFIAEAIEVLSNPAKRVVVY